MLGKKAVHAGPCSLLTSHLGVPWLYPTEINSLPMRTKGAAVATATNWLTNFIVVEITPIGIQDIGWKFCESDTPTNPHLAY